MNFDIVKFSEYSKYDRDSGGISSILSNIVKLTNTDVILYGAGNIGYMKLFWLRRRGIEPICTVDEKACDSANNFWGCPLIHPSALKGYARHKRTIAIIATSAYCNDIEHDKIVRVLIEAKVLKIFNFDIQSFPYGSWAKYYAENRHEIETFIANLGDQMSKDTIVEYVRCIMQDDFYRSESLVSNTKYIADDVFKWKSDEAIISCGMALGDTIFHISEKKPFKIIYGIESSPLSFKQANALLALLPNSIHQKIQTINNTISKKVTFDSLFIKDDISLICLDVEGSELELLMSGKNLIRNKQPVVAVCLYHMKEDIVEIPRYIKTLGEYTFYVRKYEPWKAEVSKDELVLYAVPKNRKIIPTS